MSGDAVLILCGAGRGGIRGWVKGVGRGNGEGRISVTTDAQNLRQEVPENSSAILRNSLPFTTFQVEGFISLLGQAKQVRRPSQ